MKIKFFGISGDSKLCTEIEQIVDRSEVSILDTSFVEKGEISHMGLVDIEELFEKYPNKKIIPTHMHDKTRDIAFTKKSENFIVLDDGDNFEF